MGEDLFSLEPGLVHTDPGHEWTVAAFRRAGSMWVG